MKHYECVDCPFYDSIKTFDGIGGFDYIDWCTYHNEETGICGNCDREETVLDDVEVEE